MVDGIRAWGWLDCERRERISQRVAVDGREGMRVAPLVLVQVNLTHAVRSRADSRGEGGFQTRPYGGGCVLR